MTQSRAVAGDKRKIPFFLLFLPFTLTHLFFRQEHNFNNLQPAAQGFPCRQVNKPAEHTKYWNIYDDNFPNGWTPSSHSVSSTQKKLDSEPVVVAINKDGITRISYILLLSCAVTLTPAYNPLIEKLTTWQRKTVCFFVKNPNNFEKTHFLHFLFLHSLLCASKKQ